MQKVISFEKAGVCPLATQLWFRASLSLLSSVESLKDRGLGTSFHICIAAAMLGCRDFVTLCSPCLCLCFWYSQWVSICGVPLQQIGGLLLSLSLLFSPSFSLHTLSLSLSLPSLLYDLALACADERWVDTLMSGVCGCVWGARETVGAPFVV